MIHHNSASVMNMNNENESMKVKTTEPSAPPYSFSGNPNDLLNKSNEAPKPAILSMPPHLQGHYAVVPPLLPQHARMNVPPMMYAVPGVIPVSVSSVQTNPIQALKPLPNPPPAPSLNEIELNEERTRVKCPYCYKSISTKTAYRYGTMTHIVAVAMLVVCCPLFWIPYVCECCKDVHHSCPNCGRSIGQFRRFIYR